MRSLRLVAVLLTAALAIGGVALANGIQIRFGGPSVSVKGMGGLTGQTKYPIGTTAQFVWWNDTGYPVRLTSYWVTGPAPSSRRVYGPISLNTSWIPPGSSYGPLNVPLNVQSYKVGKWYTVHVAGQLNNPFGPSVKYYHDSFTFKVIPSSSGSTPGGNVLPWWLIFLLLAQQHQNSGQPGQPSQPTVKGTGFIEAAVTLNDQLVKNATVIVYKEGTSLKKALEGEAKDVHTARTSEEGKATLEVPVGEWKVLAMKPCGEGNEYWISEVKTITVFKDFTYEVELPLTGKIRPKQ